MKTFRLFLLVVLALLSGGCVVLTHTAYEDGQKVSETTYITPAIGKKDFSDVDFRAGTLVGAKSENASVADVAALTAAATAKQYRP